jgi:uncharacterized protein (DUF4415 family)
MKEKLHDLNTTWHDPDDAPELSTDWFKTAELRHGGKVLRKGRPKAALTKKHTTIRLSREVLDCFRSTGAGWADSY